MGNFERTIGLGLVLSLAAGCGDSGADPEHIAKCTDGTKSDIELVVDTESPADNPEALLSFAESKEKKDPESSDGWSNGDTLDGLGELVCRVEVDGVTQLYLLDAAVDIRDDYIAQLEEDANSPKKVLEEIREHQATTTTSSTTTTLG